MDEGFAVFFFRWRVHQNARRAIRPVQPEVAAKARIRRGWCDPDGLIGEATGHPVGNKLIARRGLHSRVGFGSL